jgi:anthocyanidin reductase
MEKSSHLMDLQALGPLEVLRADLDDEGSFDDAVAGCDYAFLVAAPVNLHSKNPEVHKRHHCLLVTLSAHFSPIWYGTHNVVFTCSNVVVVTDDDRKN